MFITWIYQKIIWKTRGITMKKEEDKTKRVLSIYSRLKQGQTIKKEEESAKFDVAQRTIQRDIADIRRFLRKQKSPAGEIQEIVFDTKFGGYRLKKKAQNQLEPEELLVICKVLLESKSLEKKETVQIINKMLPLCSTEDDRKFIEDCIANEMSHAFMA